MAGPIAHAYSWFATTRLGRFLSRRLSWKLDPWLLRVTDGRLSTTLFFPTRVLETRGARTGARRRNAVIFFADGDDILIAASNAGAPSHPSWFYNLVADPDVVFDERPVRASVVTDDTDRLWGLADRVFPAYATYRREAAKAGRTIPLIRLLPRS